MTTKLHFETTFRNVRT